VFIGIAMAVALCDLSAAEGLACYVRVDDPAVVFPLEKMDRPTLCRLASVVNDYTTHRILPTFQTPIQKSVYDFILDHPVLAATLARHLEVASYRVARVGPNAFQGDDGGGTEGLIELLHRDTTQRVYHMRGSHRGRLFPTITGEAIILLNYRARTGSDGRESVETRITTYSRLDNPVLATIVRALQPLLRNVVNDKVAEGFLAAHKLGELMAMEPERVYRDAEGITEVDKSDVEALKALLSLPRP
jgi:hypothetical protein